MTRFFDGLDDDIKRILLGQIRNLWTHNSTALEGNSLTLGDTSFVLDEGLTISGKPLKDHREVYDHARAIELVYQLLKLEKITDAEVFNLHRAILTDYVLDIYCPIGAWKNESNYTSYITKNGKQAIREYPSALLTGKLMTQWLEKLNNFFNTDLNQDNSTKAYADLHLTFVTIHPFYDGNGRMARLLSNLPVLKSGWPPIVIPASDRLQYREIISTYQEGIGNLPELCDLNSLPESDAFRHLCANYWSETMELVNNATELQGKRTQCRQPKS